MACVIIVSTRVEHMAYNKTRKFKICFILKTVCSSLSSHRWFLRNRSYPYKIEIAYQKFRKECKSFCCISHITVISFLQWNVLNEVYLPGLLLVSLFEKIFIFLVSSAIKIQNCAFTRWMYYCVHYVSSESKLRGSFTMHEITINLFKII